MPPSMPDAEKIGLLAGWGRYPVIVAETLKHQGCRVYCLGVKGHADPELARICDDFRWIGVAKLGAQIRYFRRRGISRATMAGKLFKHLLLFHGIGWLRHLPDLRCCRTFCPHFFTGTKNRNDDALLGALVDAFAQDGITIAPATNFAPELLVKLGLISRRRLSRAETQDVQFGWHLAKEFGRLDVGQSVVVKGRVAIAVEAVEGTDLCIRRAGALCPQGGFTVVKVAKPQQDMRFDVPTIGLGTLQTMVDAGARVLAVEAGKTIILDELDVIRFADLHKLTVVAVDEANLTQLSDAA